MNSLTRLTVAAGIVLGLGVVGLLALSNHNNGGIGGQSASPSSSSPAAVASSAVTVPPPSVPASSPPSTQTADVVVDTSSWPSFSSNRYAYDVMYPSFLTASQSTRQWKTADESDWLSPSHDLFKGQVAITVFAITLPSGMTRDAWIASYFAGPAGSAGPVSCGHTQVNLPTTEVDGHPVVFWRESENGQCGGTFAFVANGNRLYAFDIGLPGWEPTLEAFLSTLKFH